MGPNICWNEAEYRVVCRKQRKCASAKYGLYCKYSINISTFVVDSIMLILRRIRRSITRCRLQYIPRNMHTVFALLCFVVVIHWLIFPYPSGLLHWHCGNLTIAPVPAKQPWWIRINTSCEFIMNDCITTTKQSTTKPCAYFLGYTVVTSNSNINLSQTLAQTLAWCQLAPSQCPTQCWLIISAVLTYAYKQH